MHGEEEKGGLASFPQPFYSSGDLKLRSRVSGPAISNANAAAASFFLSSSSSLFHLLFQSNALYYYCYYSLMDSTNHSVLQFVSAAALAVKNGSLPSSYPLALTHFLSLSLQLETQDEDGTRLGKTMGLDRS
jgi:hypothetical protein